MANRTTKMYKQPELDLSRFELVIIAQVMRNTINLTTEKEKNSPYGCYNEAVATCEKIEKYLKDTSYRG